MQFTSSLLAFASVAIYATGVAAFGAHIGKCDGGDTFYHGAGNCYDWDVNSNFKLLSLQDSCTVTGYSGGSCSSAATAIRVGECFVNVDSFSVDNCN